MDNNLIEQFKAKEQELERQLQEERAKNQRLELEMKYKDKTTDLWNRKYIEKIISDNLIDGESLDFTIVCTDIDNLDRVNQKMGANMGDALYKQIADGLQSIFGKDAICCKLVGTKMCVFLIATKEQLDSMEKEYTTFINNTKVANNDIDISYGVARKDEHPDKDINSILKEAEYALQMHKVKKETDNGEVAVKKERKANDGITILMIDDSMIILRTLQMMLKDEYHLLMSTSGMEGYEIAKAKNPDLILLDYNMPAVDGERILHLLKNSNATKHIPVVFISGVSDKDKILKVASMNIAGYLLKPVAKDDLLNTINKVLQSGV